VSVSRPRHNHLSFTPPPKLSFFLHPANIIIFPSHHYRNHLFAFASPTLSQVELVLTITGLFNFIRDNSTEVDLDEQELTGELHPEPTLWSELAAGVQEGTDEELEKLREEIACTMCRLCTKLAIFLISSKFLQFSLKPQIPRFFICH